MKLIEIFDQLTYGELSNVALGGMNDGFGIKESDYEKIAVHVNLGLLELHKRFHLKEPMVTIPVVPDQEEYTINEDDFLHIIAISDDAGNDYSLNVFNPDTPELNITTTGTSFTCTNEEVGENFHVFYRAKHAPIVPIGLDPHNLEIEINPSVLQPLLFFVASRVYASLPTLDGMNKGMEYLAKYEQACTMVDMYGLVQQNSSEIDVKDVGWV